MKTSHPDSSLPHVPSCWSWHYQRLQALRDRLLALRDIQIAEASEALEPHSMDMADSASDEFDHDMLLGILSHEQDALFELDASIRRILDGKYGVCEETGRSIPAARLRAVPWTRYIREVEERLEREGLVAGSHLGTAVSAQDSVPAAMAEVEEPEESELLIREAAKHKQQADMDAMESGIEAMFAGAGSERT